MEPLVLKHDLLFVSQFYHRYLLSVLTFISKCAAVPEPDFETLVHEHDLSLVIYNTALPPLLAAAADATPKEQDYGPRRYVGGWVDLEMVVVLGVGWG